VFGTKWDEAELTRGLGEEFLVSTTVLKRYPCHAAVRAVRDLQAEHGFSGSEVEAITVTPPSAWSSAMTFWNSPI
jgi:2-methylcitrate dehydratase PrpD